MSEDPTEQFLACFSKEQRAIYVLVRSLLFDPSDADEVFQETCLAMWRDFDKYTPGTDFGAWARQVARHRVLAHSKRRKVDRHQFSTELIEQLVKESEESGEVAEASRRSALLNCLGKLDEEDQQLIRLRYAGAETIAEFAKRMNGTASVLYKRLVRIRRQLVQCIDRSVRSSQQASSS